VIDLCNSEDEARDKPIPKPNPARKGIFGPLRTLRLLQEFPTGGTNTKERPLIHELRALVASSFTEELSPIPMEASPIPIEEKRRSIVLRIPLRRLVVQNTQDPLKRYNRLDHQPVLWLKRFCDPETTVYSFHDLDFILDLPMLGDDDLVHRRVLTRVDKAIRFTFFEREAAKNPATGVGSFCRLRCSASPASTLDDRSPRAVPSTLILECEANADFDAVVKALTHVSDRGLIAVGSREFGSVLARDLLGSDPREDESIIKAPTAKSRAKYPRPFSQLDGLQPAKKRKASSEAKDVASPVTTTTAKNTAEAADTAPGFHEQPTAAGEQQPYPEAAGTEQPEEERSSEKRKSETKARNHETQKVAEEPSPKKQKIASDEDDEDDRSAPVDDDNRSSEPPKESQEQPPTPIPAFCRNAEESASTNVASLPFSWDGTFQIIGQSDCSEATKDERSASESDATKQSESESKPSPTKEAAEDAGDLHGATEYIEVPLPYYDTENRVPEDESPFAKEHPSVEEEEEENEEENEGEVSADSESDRLDTGLEVESRDEEDLQHRNNEGQLGIVREMRALLGDIVSSIVERAGGRRQDTARDIGDVNDDNDDNDRNELWNFTMEGMMRPENNLLLKSDAEEAEAEDLAAEPELDEQEQDYDPITAISMGSLMVLALPLACLAGMFARLGLVDLSNSILEGCFRSFLQLHVLGWLLSPIFRWGNRHPVLVSIYSLFMIALASYEASSRTKYAHEDQLYVVAKSLAMNVGWIVLWAFGVVLKPKPLWNPRYLIPIVGMLLGNSINGVSIALDTLTTSLVERRAEVDLYLSFGGTQYEAVSGMLAHAIQKGATPSLNIMCVVGIVSIPGMMAGQILGGSSPMLAARYQAMMLVLIALATLSTIFVSSSLTVLSAFCSHQILRPERLVKNRKRSLGRLILWAWGYVFGGTENVPMGAKLGSMGESSMTPTASKTNFRVLPVRKGYDNGGDVLLQAMDLGKHFGDEKDDDASRSLFYGFSLDIDEGDLYFVSGPNGSGKSQLLRILAGLSPFQDGSLRLEGKDWEKDYDGKLAVKWRKNIRYVPQTRVHIPGTPRQFIRRIRSFHSWRESDTGEHRYRQALYMNHRILQYLDQWGLSPDCLDRDWSILSGGEAQRVLIAIAMASRPKLLLFDESTSALDPGSKLAVEASVMEYVANYEGGVVWVSHEEEQVGRMKLTTTAAMHPGPSTVIQEVPIPSVGMGDVPRPHAGVEEDAYYPRPYAGVEGGAYYPRPSAVVDESAYYPRPSAVVDESAYYPRPSAVVDESAYYPRPSAVVEEGPYYY